MTTFHDKWPELGIEDGVYEGVDGGGDVAQPQRHIRHAWCLPENDDVDVDKGQRGEYNFACSGFILTL